MVGRMRDSPRQHPGIRAIDVEELRRLLEPFVGLLGECRASDILAALGKVPDVDKAFGDTTVRWVKQAIATSGRGADEIVADVSKTLKATPEPKKAGQALDVLIDGLGSLPADDRAKAIEEFQHADDVALTQRQRRRGDVDPETRIRRQPDFG